MSDDEAKTQYATSANLARRADLHVAYGSVSWFGWLAERLRIPPDSRVIDIGCGPGWYWHGQAKTLPTDLRLTLVDTSRGMVSEAMERLSDAPFAAVAGQVADAAALPFPDASFDVAVMMHMLYHVPEPERAIAEAARVLRPGGMFYATVNAADDLQSITDLIVDVFNSEPMDFAACRVPLEDAERLIAPHFQDVRRHDMTDLYRCSDPDIVEAFILSMPPANRAEPGQRQVLTARIAEAFDRGGGILDARKHSGVIVGTKNPSDTSRAM